MTIPEIFQHTMQADRYRLQQLWQRTQPQWQQDANCSAYQKWMHLAEQSAERYRQRSATFPALTYDPELPITAHRQQLIELLQTRQTIVVCGETGSGKSTQLPKICLEAGLGRSGMIGHTQPRRLAARAVASRLSDELQTQVGNLVGFKIRFADATGSQTLIKLMTDGVLLAETQSDRFLEQYDAIILDEAHERSLNIDFLLGYLRRLQAKRPELKLIITSATIDPERFANHFTDSCGPAPVVEVSGRTYPVEIRYSPPAELVGDQDLDEQIYQRAIAESADSLLAAGRGNILVFLPTERDIRVTNKYLRGHFTSRRAQDIEILPLYARLSQAEQNKIFAAHSQRRIILATNVAESSLTVPGIHYVIDTGLVRLSRYSARSKLQRLPIEPISQASANQRSGRCGRLGPGICIRLYAESDFLSRPAFTTPEIRRSDLANVMLQSYLLRLGPLDQFPLLDMPAPELIRDAMRTLRELQALDDRHELTEIGKQLGLLPCDVRVGRMLLEAHQRRCLNEVTIIAAALESQDVRFRPAGQQPQADQAHRQFADPHSDFLSYVRLWDFYQRLQSELGRSRLQKALNQNYLSHHAFREWADILRQLRDIMAEAGCKIESRHLVLGPVSSSDLLEKGPSKRSNGRQTGSTVMSSPETNKLPERPEGYAAVHQSLLAGLLSSVAMRSDQFEYKAAGGMAIRVWPGSSQFRRSPKWIMAAEIVETSQRFARTVADVDVEWIEHAAGDLLKHSFNQPHWSEKSGAAMVYRQSTLYGLTVVSGRRVPLATVNPAEAREMLIEHGLIQGQWRCDLSFYRHNCEMIADMHELVRRTRSNRYIIDQYHLANFYSARLPESITDLNSLSTWVRRHQGTPEERSLWLQESDLVDENQDHPDVARMYPNTLTIGAAEYPLAYHFEPGHVADGVTITVPHRALRQLSEESLAWLVPGMLTEKVLAIIRGLPKSLRTNFVPAPDVAKTLAFQLDQTERTAGFAHSLAQAMSAYCGQTIDPAALNIDRVPDQHRFLIRVIDDHGEQLAAGRDLQQLAAQYGLSIESSSVASLPSQAGWVNREIRSAEELDQLPEQLLTVRGGIKVPAYVAVVDMGQSVQAQLVDTQMDAQRHTRQGMLRLFALKNDKLLKTQLKNLPKLNESSLSLSSIMPSSELHSNLRDLICRVALIDNLPPVKNFDQWMARQARASVQISMATQEISSWLPNLATHYHRLRLKLEKSPASWKEVCLSVEQQVAELMMPGFLRDTPWQWLKEIPRYLQAANMRLEKLSSGGIPKDRGLARAIETLRHEYLLIVKSTKYATDDPFAQRVDQLKWMIEELRVSVFAQQLGTKISISEKKIRDVLQQLGPVVK